jgi:hypothetical protein
MSLIIPANSLAGGGYAVDNSLRCEATSNDYLNRTVGTPTDEDVWTFSTWFKVTAKVPVAYRILGAGNYPSQYEEIYLSSGQKIEWYNDGGASNRGYILSSGVLRDSSAWYHLVCIRNGATVEMWLNGINVGVLNTAFNNSYNTINKSGQALRVAQGERATSGRGWDGYISETHFIDGQALTPTDFGEFDADSGVWKPIVYEGTYGTNGFFLEFQDSGALGTDSSGNANTFTVNNLTSIDQTTDTPTNNFCTLNPLATSSYSTLSQGNTVSTGNSPLDNGNTYGTLSASSGKWYAECKAGTIVANYTRVGIKQIIYSEFGRLLNSTQGMGGYSASTEFYVRADGGLYSNNTTTSSWMSTYTTNDIIGIAVDYDNGASYVSKNGVWQNSGDPTSGASKTGASATWTPSSQDGFVFYSGDYNGSVSQWNFGNAPYTIASGNADANGYGNFEYAVPTGFYALCTKNLSEVNS